MNPAFNVAHKELTKYLYKYSQIEMNCPKIVYPTAAQKSDRVSHDEWGLT